MRHALQAIRGVQTGKPEHGHGDDEYPRQKGEIPRKGDHPGRRQEIRPRKDFETDEPGKNPPDDDQGQIDGEQDALKQPALLL